MKDCIPLLNLIIYWVSREFYKFQWGSETGHSHQIKLNVPGMGWPCVWYQKRAISYNLLISLQLSISISTTEVDPHSDSLHNDSETQEYRLYKVMFNAIRIRYPRFLVVLIST